MSANTKSVLNHEEPIEIGLTPDVELRELQEVSDTIPRLAEDVDSLRCLCNVTCSHTENKVMKQVGEFAPQSWQEIDFVSRWNFSNNRDQVSISGGNLHLRTFLAQPCLFRKRDRSLIAIWDLEAI